MESRGETPSFGNAECCEQTVAAKLPFSLYQAVGSGAPPRRPIPPNVIDEDANPLLNCSEIDQLKSVIGREASEEVSFGCDVSTSSFCTEFSATSFVFALAGLVSQRKQSGFSSSARSKERIGFIQARSRPHQQDVRHFDDDKARGRR